MRRRRDDATRATLGSALIRQDVGFHSDSSRDCRTSINPMPTFSATNDNRNDNRSPDRYEGRWLR
jgi:hypothetical protein